jgi:hypothetical protein
MHAIVAVIKRSRSAQYRSGQPYIARYVTKPCTGRVTAGTIFGCVGRSRTDGHGCLTEHPWLHPSGQALGITAMTWSR